MVACPQALNKRYLVVGGLLVKICDAIDSYWGPRGHQPLSRGYTPPLPPIQKKGVIAVLLVKKKRRSQAILGAARYQECTTLTMPAFEPFDLAAYNMGLYTFEASCDRMVGGSHGHNLFSGIRPRKRIKNTEE